MVRDGGPVDRYDLVVLGGGSAGLTAARLAGHLGAKVLLAERGRLGGDCLWTGCV
ncbi:MAG: FAD-dependent oxidoreductase, partial [Actinomycetota bacterium]|nr:FAD-dependent oxidoreductase [Actinomycetota bacterium]